MTRETKLRTITMTGRAPVRIDETAWPVLAKGIWNDYSGQNEYEANRSWQAALRVRQHADGRAIVYATYTACCGMGVGEYDTRFQGERNLSIRVGLLFAPDADLAEAITQVGHLLGQRLADEDESFPALSSLIAGCIADLPSETLE